MKSRSRAPSAEVQMLLIGQLLCTSSSVLTVGPRVPRNPGFTLVSIMGMRPLERRPSQCGIGEQR